MYGFFTFFHIIGVIVWLGLLISLAILLPMLKCYLNIELGQKIIYKTIHIFKPMMHVASIVVLISGFYLISQINVIVSNNTFWVNYMISVGSFIVISSIISMELLGRRVTIPLSSHMDSLKVPYVSKQLSSYVTSIVLIMLIVISIILVVSFKL